MKNMENKDIIHVIKYDKFKEGDTVYVLAEGRLLKPCKGVVIKTPCISTLYDIKLDDKKDEIVGLPEYRLYASQEEALKEKQMILAEEQNKIFAEVESLTQKFNELKKYVANVFSAEDGIYSATKEMRNILNKIDTCTKRIAEFQD
jgi:hypothetical protein